MIVCYNVTSRIDNEPRAQRHHFFRGIAELKWLSEESLEELTEKRVAGIERRIALLVGFSSTLRRRLLLQLDRDVDDRRRDALDERCETWQRDIDLVLGLPGEVRAGLVRRLGASNSCLTKEGRAPAAKVPVKAALVGQSGAANHQFLAGTCAHLSRARGRATICRGIGPIGPVLTREAASRGGKV